LGWCDLREGRSAATGRVTTARGRPGSRRRGGVLSEFATVKSKNRGGSPAVAGQERGHGRRQLIIGCLAGTTGNTVDVIHGTLGRPPRSRRTRRERPDSAFRSDPSARLLWSAFGGRPAAEPGSPRRGGTVGVPVGLRVESQAERVERRAFPGRSGRGGSAGTAPLLSATSRSATRRRSGAGREPRAW
jgi:hypothetical protein